MSCGPIHNITSRIQRIIKLGCDCLGCGCSRWFWTAAPVWVAVGIAVGYWWIGGNPADITSGIE